ncbi:MAG: DUF2301 domain-containing membrane protein [Cyanobacteria bacterium P01_E01_bin.45]
MQSVAMSSEVYQGQFGEFTITKGDRRGVVVYRSALMVAALSFAISSGLVLWQPQALSSIQIAWAITGLFGLFSVAMGVALWTIHIYMRPLHRALQVLWGIGTVSAIALAATSLPNPLALAVFQQPLMVLGIGFTFAALTGLFVKEAFCFNRLETKALAPVVPLLLLGHLLGFMPLQGKVVLLAIWASLFLVFAIRKAFQAIPPDIGDKSVFDYLAKVRSGEISPEAGQAVS